jgi:hypothetical protein
MRGQTGVARTRARTPKQIERQEQVFALSVLHGKSHRAIAATLKVNKKTVSRDIEEEAQRRADEIEHRRDVEQAMHLARIDHLYRRGLDLAGTPGAGGLAAAGKALEMRARMLGLEKAPPVDDFREQLLRAMEGKPPG